MVMAYLAFALCFCWIQFCTSGGESINDGMSQGINDVGVDFHSPRLRSNNSVVDSSDVHSTWIWQPIGQEKNEIKSEPIVRLFKDDWASGTDNYTYEEPESEAEKEEIWIFNATIELRVNTTQRPKLTVDRRRNRTIEKTYLTLERRLRKTNWCFKDLEDAKLNKTKFKVALWMHCLRGCFLAIKHIHSFSILCVFMCKSGNILNVQIPHKLNWRNWADKIYTWLFIVNVRKFSSNVLFRQQSL